MDNDKVHDKETHGRSDDINEMTPIDKVKAPDLFHRAKEEVEALVDAFRSNKESDNQIAKVDDKQEKSSNLEQIVSVVTELQGHQERVHKESHGTSSNVNESTKTDEVIKAPNLFGRAKEEIQAVVHSIQSRKEVNKQSEETKNIGFWEFLGGMLQKFCSPSRSKTD